MLLPILAQLCFASEKTHINLTATDISLITDYPFTSELLKDYINKPNVLIDKQGPYTFFKLSKCLTHSELVRVAKELRNFPRYQVTINNMECGQLDRNQAKDSDIMLRKVSIGTPSLAVFFNGVFKDIQVTPFTYELNDIFNNLKVDGYYQIVINTYVENPYKLTVAEKKYIQTKLLEYKYKLAIGDTTRYPLQANFIYEPEIVSPKMHMLYTELQQTDVRYCIPGSLYGQDIVLYPSYFNLYRPIPNLKYTIDTLKYLNRATDLEHVNKELSLRYRAYIIICKSYEDLRRVLIHNADTSMYVVALFTNDKDLAHKITEEYSAYAGYVVINTI